MKNDHVRNLDGNEGVVTEVFISYPSLCGLADWSAPRVHYRVTLGPNSSKLYDDGELTDIRQMEMDLRPTITAWENGAADEGDYWWNKDWVG